jgi:hypothetical protein
MNTNQFLGYQMAAREACKQGDSQTLDQINAIVARSAMRFVWKDGELKMEWLTLTEVEKAVA